MTSYCTFLLLFPFRCRFKFGKIVGHRIYRNLNYTEICKITVSFSVGTVLHTSSQFFCLLGPGKWPLWCACWSHCLVDLTLQMFCPWALFHCWSDVPGVTNHDMKLRNRLEIHSPWCLPRQEPVVLWLLQCQHFHRYQGTSSPSSCSWLGLSTDQKRVHVHASHRFPRNVKRVKVWGNSSAFFSNQRASKSEFGLEMECWQISKAREHHTTVWLLVKNESCFTVFLSIKPWVHDWWWGDSVPGSCQSLQVRTNWLMIQFGNWLGSHRNGQWVRVF